MIIKDVLSGKKNFDNVYKKGRSVPDRFIVVFYKKNNLGINRISFLASKKVGNAVKRNRARRLMKQGYREIEGSLKEGFDIIFIARNTIDNRKCQEVKKSMELALKKTAMNFKV